MDKAKLISSLKQIKELADECLAGFQDSAEPKRVAKRSAISSPKPRPTKIDFDKPMRPFIKEHAKGMNGQEKFTLLLSWLVKGDLNKEAALSEIKKNWNKMKSKDLLGMDFNYFFPGEAKDNDWVECKKKGFYNLRPDWKKIFASSNA